MCVAVIVESEKPLTKEYLKAMHEANPHGGGIAWYDGDTVMFRKGMSWEEIHAIHDKLPRPFLMHFRIATKGAKIPELTHPFPIGMQAFTEDLVGIAEKGVIIHNGTWHDFHKYVPNGIDASKVSDTQIAAYVAGFNSEVLDEVRWSNAIMTPKGILFRGNWEMFEGNRYSNLHWKRELIDWSDYRHWGNFYGSRTSSRTFSHSTPSSRTTTPLDSRKKGMSHQEGRTQENGRTKDARGGNTIQSNGKTINENRAAAKKKQKKGNSTSSKGESAYDLAKEAYTSSLRLSNSANENMTRQRGKDWDWDKNEDWESERLFDDSEIPGYNFPRTHTPALSSRTRTPNLDIEKYLGPSVPCPDCGDEIVQIPCKCGMDSEEDMEVALAALDEEFETQLELLETEEIELEEIALSRAPTERLDAGDVEDLNACGLDSEDLNDYGMGLGMDAMPGDAGDYLDPDWKAVDAAIRKQGIKL